MENFLLEDTRDSNICILFNGTKHQFDSCLDHISKHQVDLETSANTSPQSCTVKRGLIHKTFYFLFVWGEDSTKVNKIKQYVHALKRKSANAARLNPRAI